MKTAYAALALVCAALLGGCSIPSLHGVYTADKSVDDAALAGHWESDDGETAADIVRKESGYFEVTSTLSDKDKEEPPQVMTFEARLVQLGNARFADLVLSEDERSNMMKRYNALAIRTHQFMKVVRDGDTVQLWMPDYDHLKGLLEGGKSGLAFERVDDAVNEPETVITASTADLQKFFAAHAEDKELFSDPLVMKRKVKP